MVIRINGREIRVPDGAAVSVRNNTVYVNGEPWDDPQNGEFKESVLVRVEGGLASLSTDGDAVVNGEVRGDARAGTSLLCGAVHKDARAGTSLQVSGDVGGDAKAGTDCHVGGSVGGSVRAGLNVYHGRKG